MLIASILTLIGGVVIANVGGLLLGMMLMGLGKAGVFLSTFIVVILAVFAGVLIFEWQTVQPGWYTVALAVGPFLLNEIIRLRARPDDPTRHRTYSFYGGVAGALLASFYMY